MNYPYRIRHKKVHGQKKCVCGQPMLFNGKEMVCLEVMANALKEQGYKIQKEEEK